MGELTVEVLDDFRSTRKLAPRTSAKDLVILRQFFSFAADRKWIAENPAKRIKPPRNIKPSKIVPYTTNEMTRILAACDEIGNSAYERRRARTLILLLRTTGLRISDAATFSRDRMQNGRIFLRTPKTGEAVFLPMSPELQKELDHNLAGRRRVRGATSGTSEAHLGRSSATCRGRCGRCLSARA